MEPAATIRERIAEVLRETDVPYEVADRLIEEGLAAGVSPPSAIPPPIREEARENTRLLLGRAVRLLRDGYPDVGRYHEATETARDLSTWASSLRLDGPVVRFSSAAGVSPSPAPPAMTAQKLREIADLLDGALNTDAAWEAVADVVTELRAWASALDAGLGQLSPTDAPSHAPPTVAASERDGCSTATKR